MEARNDAYYRPFLGRVVINGFLRSQTGIHIGSGRETMEIQGVDAPVVRDPITKEPYIPGSSLKGKCRALLEKYISVKTEGLNFYNRNMQKEPVIRIHVCDTAKDAYGCSVCRLFGSSAGKSNSEETSNFPARLRFRDAFLTRYSVEKLRDAEFLYTEVKSENVLDRLTAAAMPRQIERVPAGADFCFELIYDVEDEDQIEEDLKSISFFLTSLEEDSIGGHGSRGYGRVSLHLTRVIAKKAESYQSTATSGTDSLVLTIYESDEITRNSKDEPKDLSRFEKAGVLSKKAAEISEFFRRK